ncbi:MAG: DUF1294 domain-containing protein [Ruminococcus sp.]|nr:DUF1294 domain-containing protein [Ruminococcus sp.]
MYTYIFAAAAVYFAVMSVISLILYKADKVKAQKGKWRIKEATLLGFGFFGGALGALAGMKLFRHKTKHWYFRVINTAGLLLQIAILVFLIVKIIQA